MENIEYVLGLTVTGDTHLVDAFCLKNKTMGHKLTAIYSTQDENGVVSATFTNPNCKVDQLSSLAMSVSYHLPGQWDEALELSLLFNPLPKPTFKINDWIKFDGKIGKIKKIFMSEGEKRCYIYPSSNLAHSKHNNSIPLHSIYKNKTWVGFPTKEEVEDHILKEAESRGFVKGVEYKNTDGGTYTLTNPIRHYQDSLTLFSDYGTGLIYRDCINKWGSVLEPSTVEVNGYTAEYYRAYVKFGCAKIKNETFLAAKALMDEASKLDHINNRSLSIIRIGFGNFTSEQIEIITNTIIEKAKERDSKSDYLKDSQWF